LVGLRPKNPDELQSIYNDLVSKTKSNPNLEVYLRDVNMPERYHFSNNKRIAPLWIVPKAGWSLVTMKEMHLKEAQEKGEEYHPRGLHGYDHEHPLMRAIFIARGPAFPHKPNSRIQVFQNTEVYNVLCDSVGIAPAQNNGTIRLPFKPIGLHSDPIENPADPVKPATTSTAVPSDVTSLASSKPILVHPVTPGSGFTTTLTDAPSKSLGVDPPDAHPTDQPGGDGDQSEDEGDENKGGVGSAVSGFWDWFTGKVSHWWDKVKGATSGEKKPDPEPDPEPFG